MLSQTISMASLALSKDKTQASWDKQSEAKGLQQKHTSSGR